MAAKDKSFYPKKTLNLNGKILDLTVPRVMGILNITPDSFYDGGRFEREKTMLLQAEKMVADGTDIIDVGGYSSRPRASDITPEEEWSRLRPSLRALQKNFPDVPLSVDTFRASIARQAIDEGAAMINDIAGGTLDTAMFETIAALRVPYVLMHMRGSPADMHLQTEYDDLFSDIFNALQKRHAYLTQSGVADVIIDVGFGFAKTRFQNFELLKNLGRFGVIGAPLLTGLSRKSLVWKTLDCTPEEALNGTTVLNTLALQSGADILRVHDVREAVETITLFQMTSM